MIETSAILWEGLSGVIKKSGIRCRLFHAESFDQAELIHARNSCDAIVVNPSYFYRNAKSLALIKSRFESAKWFAFIYSWHDPDILAQFDALINISDSVDSIVATICKLDAAAESNSTNQLQEILTERETDVLKLLAKGFANKEIADKLNISINTVITHRKNISQKTGIKSVSGLTIYAVVQKLISIDNPTE